jgi:Ribbon-helix-helix domain
MTRWTLVISDDTDKALRTFLAQTGGKKGDLSDFVEKAVRDKLFHLTVGNIKQRNSVFDQAELTNLINEAVVNVRTSTPHA